MNKAQLIKVVHTLTVLKEKLKCPICLDVIQEVVELDCGHKYCEECYLQHKSAQKQPTCPLCKKVLKRRSILYTDTYANALGKFVHNSCKNIRSFYNCEVEELQKTLSNGKGLVLQEHSDIIQKTNRGKTDMTLVSSPTNKKTRIKKSHSKENCKDAFDRLMNAAQDPMTFNKEGTNRVYTNKKKLEKKPSIEYNILQFDNYENKAAVLQWLNDTRNKFDRLTQTQNLYSEEQESPVVMDMVSISQVKEKKGNFKPGLYRCTRKERAKSLDVEIKKVTSKEYKRHSHGGASETAENYNIEEINTEEEKVVKKAEEKVLLDLIEDELLDKLESEMQNEPKMEAKLNKSDKGLKTTSQTSATGWDRLTKIKKTIKKGEKELKQLNVTLQSTQNVKNENKDPKSVNNIQLIEVDGVRTSNLATNKCKILNADKQRQKGEDDVQQKKTTEMVTENEGKNAPSYDLERLEDYITKNIKLIEENTSLTNSNLPSQPEKSTAEDFKKPNIEEKDEIVKAPKKVVTPAKEKGPPDEKEHHKTVNSSVIDDLFEVATQRLSNSRAKSDQIKDDVIMVEDDHDLEELYARPTQRINHVCKMIVNDINENCNTAPELINLLEEILEKCGKRSIGSGVFENHMLAMKYYVSKLKTLSSNPPAEVVKDTVATCAAETQTAVDTVDKMVQSNVSNRAMETQTAINTVDRMIQVNVSNRAVQTQTNVDCPKCSCSSGFDRAKLISQNTKNAIASMLDESEVNFKPNPPHTQSNKQKSNISKSKQPLENDILTSTFDNLNFDTQDITKKQEITVKGSQRQVNDVPREVKSAMPGISAQATQPSAGSVLVCSLNGTQLKVNGTMMTCDADKSKKFKRIRTPSSDTDSEDENPRKKLCNRFVRNDLTVEFDTNTVVASGERAAKAVTLESQDSENVNYDDYLAQLMKKYDNSFSDESEKEKPALEAPDKEILNSIIVKCEERINQANKDIARIKRMSQTSSSKDSFRAASQNINNNFDEALTASDKIFMDENNLQKIESAIQDYERDSVKAQNTENSDIVVDTEELEPLPKRRRKTTTNVDNPESVSLFGRSEDDASQKNPKSANNLNKICSELDDDFDEAGLENMEISDKQDAACKAGTNHNAKVNIIENVKIKSPDKEEVEKEEDDLFSDEDIVETTPQKKVNSFAERSFLSQIDKLDNLLTKSILPNLLTEADHFDFDVDALPPPPDFQDNVQKSTNSSEEEPTVIQAATTITNLNKCSLTPDKLSQFIANKQLITDFDMSQALSPCIVPYNKDNEDDQDDLTLTPKELSQLMVSKAQKGICHSTPITQRSITRDTLGFSPISAKKNRASTVTDAVKYTPLTSVTRNTSQKQNTPLTSVTRNTSQKQNILSSTPKQRSIWNYVKSSQSDDESNQVTASKPCIACTRLSKDQVKCISQLTSKKLASYSSVFDSSVTHMIVAVNEENCIKDYTIKFVSAVAAGIWVLKFEWIEECLSNNQIVPEEPFEALDTSGSPGPKTSRLTRKINPLFKGYKFFCAEPFASTDRKEVENAISMLGGKILSGLKELRKDDGNVGLIIGEGNATQDLERYERWAELYKAVTVDIEWLSKCIGQYKLISLRPYVWCLEDNLGDLGYPPYLTETVPLSFTETF